MGGQLMNKFAFVVHPLTIEDYARKFPMAKYLPRFVLKKTARVLPPFKVSSITGIRSAFGEVNGEFIGCPLDSSQLVGLPAEEALEKVISSVKLAKKNGAEIVGLGAFTAVVGDAGITVAQKAGVPVTTGNSYTVSTALEGAKMAARLMGIKWEKAEVAILGASGSIGSACTHLLARENVNLTLVGRQQVKLEKLAAKVLYDTGLAVRVTGDVKDALRQADIVLAVTSSLDYPVEPEHLKPGCVVCDIARPRDVSPRVRRERRDVLVIDGGIVDVPGEPEFNLDFGLPPGKCFACMAETMILALEKRFECYSLGRKISIDRIQEITSLAAKHGFKLAGLRSFDRTLTDGEIEEIRANAEKARKRAV
jgi:fatty aldehyde-generating acyl-ACP reductase